MKLTDTTSNALATTSFVSWLSAISTLWNPIISMIGGSTTIIHTPSNTPTTFI
jgi:hypothetical protein